MPVTVDLSVINAALTRTGNDPITSLDDNSIAATVASQNYDSLVESCLASHPWKRASKVASLTLIDADVEGDPPSPWLLAYQIPNDFVEIRTVNLAGVPIDYEVHGDKILTNTAEGDDIVMLYIWRVPESDWPAWFREGVTRQCEALFLRGISERYQEARERDAAAKDQFATARNRDSQSQPARDPVTSATLMARGGISDPIRRWPSWLT